MQQPPPEMPPIDTAPLLQWFSQWEIDNLLRPQLQAEVNCYVFACRKPQTTERGIRHFVKAETTSRGLTP